MTFDPNPSKGLYNHAHIVTLSCFAMTGENLSSSFRADFLAWQAISVSLDKLLLDPDLVEVHDRLDFRE